MGRTVTVEEAKSRTAYDLIPEAAQTQQPLIVTLENGKAVTIQQYELSAHSSNKPIKLNPLLTLPGYVADGWKDALYDNA